MFPSWLKINGGSAQILLHVQPGAKTTEIAGIHDNALKVRVAAAAIDGKANAALCAFIAKTLDISARNVRIQGGQKSRRKILKIAALDDETIQKLEQMGM
ncbi:DUF167 domain-containing protein [Sulfuriferula sp. GW1]|uniref:DUF167 domain-containing protein n=1 Tax=Sulfuriferula sp. GW1 TaxID=3345111 RepID=UPI0039B00763